MANRRPKPEEIVTKLRQVEVLVGHTTSKDTPVSFRVGDIRFPNLVECINHISVVGCID